MTELTASSGRALLLVTKLHPPSVPAQTVARERLFERLREGRGRRLSLVACPAGFGKSTLLAAWRESELGAAARRVGDARRGRRRRGRPVVARRSRRCAAPAPALAHAELAALVAAAPLREVVLPRLVNALAEQGEVALVLDDFHRLSSASTRESVAWFVEHLPATVQLVLSTRTDPALPLGDAARPRPAARAARRRPALHRRRGGRVPQRRGSASSSTPPTSSCSSRAPRAGPPASTSPRCRWRARRTSTALVPAFDGTSAHVVDFLAGEVLAAHAPELQRFMLRTSVLERLCAPLCDAVLGDAGLGARRSTSLARTNLFLLPLDDRRRWFRFHHLFAQILRRRAGAARAGARAGAAPPRVRVAPRVRHRPTRRSTTPSRPARSRGRRLIAETWVHYANAGRTASVLEWLRALPAGSSTPTAAAARRGVGRRRCAAARTTCARAAARVRALGGLDDGPLPGRLRLARVQPLGAERDVRLGRRGGDPRARRALGASSRAPDSPWRPVITWALGWAHYCNGDLDEAERWLRGDGRARARGRAVDRRRRRDRRPVADRGHARAPRRAAAAGATRRSTLARERGLLDARRGRRGAHRATASRSPRTAGRRGAPRARAGRVPAPPVGPAARPGRRADRARADRRRRSATASARAALFDEARGDRCAAAPTRARCPRAWPRRGAAARLDRGARDDAS